MAPHRLCFVLGDASRYPGSHGDNYTRLLEALFLIRRLSAWGRTLRSRTAHSPKLHVVDSGLAAYLLGITPENLEVDTKALRGLVALRDSLGDQFRAGYFLNTGSEAYQIDDRIFVCPIDRLWQTNGT